MRWYRFLLRLLPEEFRARHGLEMERVFFGQLADARRRGGLAVAGLYLQAALDVAQFRVGGVVRGVRRRGEVGMSGWVEQRFMDLRGAVRSYARTPVFAGAAVGTLALGIGALTAVFSVVDGVVLSPLPYPDPEELVVLYNRYPTLGVERGSQSPGDLDDYRSQADRLAAVSSVSTFPQTIMEDGQPRRVEVALVTPGFFSMLGVQPATGRDISPDDDHDVALVSHAYWREELGGDPGVLGRTLAFAGVSKTIIGVLPRDFRLVVPSNFGVPARPAIWTPIPAQGWGRDSGDRTAHWMNVVGRLGSGTAVAQLQEQMDQVARGQRELLPRRAEREAEIAVVPLRDEIVRDVRPALLALMWAAGVVVLIACANVANLLLVRGQRRRSEIGIRHALGAGNARIIQLLITEGALLGATGAILGVAAAWAGISVVLGLEPGNLPRADAVGIDLGVLGFVALVAVSVTLLFSVAPVWLATREDIGEVVKSGGRVGHARRGHAVSSSLIVGELALSLVLLAGGGVLVRSFVTLLDTDPGFMTESVLTFKAPLPASAFQRDPPEGYTGRPDFNFVRKPYYDELTRALGALPGVEAVGGIFPTPLSGDLSSSTYAIEGTAGGEEGDLASSQLVTPEYFATVGIPFVEGRTFLPDETGDKVVIDRRMAEALWPGRSALGKRVEVGWWSGPIWGEVVGVVESVRSHSLTEENPPTIYRLGTVYAYSAMTMMLRVKGDPLALVDDVRAAIREVEPEAPVIEVRPMAELVADQSAQTRFVLALVGVFATLALGLAAVGLYGVISFAVGQRVREYGIRLAFGAGRGRVFGLVLRRGAALTAIGLALGLCGAYLARRVVEPFLFGVEPMDPLSLVSIMALIAAVALVACAVPAARAMFVDPARSLRAE